MIYHIAEQNVWDAQSTLPDYKPDAYATEGFIHCSNYEQVVPTSERYYQGRDDLVILEVDQTKLTSEVRYENLLGGAEQFPHVYGTINKTALNRILTLADFAA